MTPPIPPIIDARKRLSVRALTRKDYVGLIIAILFMLCMIRGAFAFLGEGVTAVWYRMVSLLPVTRCADGFWQPIVESKDIEAAYDSASPEFHSAYSREEFIATLQHYIESAGPPLQRELWEHRGRRRLGKSKSAEALISFRVAGTNGVFYAFTFLAWTNNQWQVCGVDLSTVERSTREMSAHISDKVTPATKMEYYLEPMR
jgi:hypothetical protein